MISPNNMGVIINAERKRKWVQVKVGEILTSDDVAARLFNEDKARRQRKAKKQAS